MGPPPFSTETGVSDYVHILMKSTIFKLQHLHCMNGLLTISVLATQDFLIFLFCGEAIHVLTSSPQRLELSKA